ncbi:MAG: YihY family inner membrane protein [Nitrospirota bacterium]|nr:YihY family inner membrane protein [Nitrospirota bacterium]
MIVEAARRIRLIIEETFRSFGRNNDLAAASSLAFTASLALIPALFLVTYLLGLTVGSSQTALAKIQELLKQFLPAYSQEILKEVRYIVAYKGAIGLVNGAVLLLSITPLASSLRDELGTIFRRRPHRPFLLEKFYDFILTVIFLTGIAAIGAIGVIITLARKEMQLPFQPGYFEGIAPILFFIFTVYLLYVAFSEGMPKRYLFAGALMSALLWFAMRPLFHLFLTYNAGFGFAFGSFKSLFVVILWMYYSLIVFLFGAELAASLDRRDIAVVRRLTANSSKVPATLAQRSIARYDAGSTVFAEGDEGDSIFYIVRGGVTIRKGEREIATVGPGQYFGVVSFLLETPRIATAMTAEDSELLVITRQKLGHLMQDSPETIISMLREVALRLRNANKLME